MVEENCKLLCVGSVDNFQWRRREKVKKECEKHCLIEKWIPNKWKHKYHEVSSSNEFHSSNLTVPECRAVEKCQRSCESLARNFCADDEKRKMKAENELPFPGTDGIFSSVPYKYQKRLLVYDSEGKKKNGKENKKQKVHEVPLLYDSIRSPMPDIEHSSQERRKTSQKLPSCYHSSSTKKRKIDEDSTAKLYQMSSSDSDCLVICDLQEELRKFKKGNREALVNNSKEVERKRTKKKKRHKPVVESWAVVSDSECDYYDDSLTFPTSRKTNNGKSHVTKGLREKEKESGEKSYEQLLPTPSGREKERKGGRKHHSNEASLFKESSSASLLDTSECSFLGGHGTYSRKPKKRKSKKEGLILPNDTAAVGLEYDPIVSAEKEINEAELVGSPRKNKKRKEEHSRHKDVVGLLSDELMDTSLLHSQCLSVSRHVPNLELSAGKTKEGSSLLQNPIPSGDSEYIVISDPQGRLKKDSDIYREELVVYSRERENKQKTQTDGVSLQGESKCSPLSNSECHSAKVCETGREPLYTLPKTLHRKKRKSTENNSRVEYQSSSGDCECVVSDEQILCDYTGKRMKKKGKFNEVSLHDESRFSPLDSEYLSPHGGSISQELSASSLTTCKKKRKIREDGLLTPSQVSSSDHRCDGVHDSLKEQKGHGDIEGDPLAAGSGASWNVKKKKKKVKKHEANEVLFLHESCCSAVSDSECFSMDGIKTDQKKSTSGLKSKKKKKKGGVASRNEISDGTDCLVICHLQEELKDSGALSCESGEKEKETEKIKGKRREENVSLLLNESTCPVNPHSTLVNGQRNSCHSDKNIKGGPSNIECLIPPSHVLDDQIVSEYSKKRIRKNGSQGMSSYSEVPSYRSTSCKGVESIKKNESDCLSKYFDRSVDKKEIHKTNNLSSHETKCIDSASYPEGKNVMLSELVLCKSCEKYKINPNYSPSDCTDRSLDEKEIHKRNKVSPQETDCIDVPDSASNPEGMNEMLSKLVLWKTCGKYKTDRNVSVSECSDRDLEKKKIYKRNRVSSERIDVASNSERMNVMSFKRIFCKRCGKSKVNESDSLSNCTGRKVDKRQKRLACNSEGMDEMLSKLVLCKGCGKYKRNQPDSLRLYSDKNSEKREINKRKKMLSEGIECIVVPDPANNSEGMNEISCELFMCNRGNCRAIDQAGKRRKKSSPRISDSSLPLDSLDRQRKISTCSLESSNSGNAQNSIGAARGSEECFVVFDSTDSIENSSSVCKIADIGGNKKDVSEDKKKVFRKRDTLLQPHESSCEVDACSQIRGSERSAKFSDTNSVTSPLRIKCVSLPGNELSSSSNLSPELRESSESNISHYVEVIKQSVEKGNDCGKRGGKGKEESNKKSKKRKRAEEYHREDNRIVENKITVQTSGSGSSVVGTRSVCRTSNGKVNLLASETGEIIDIDNSSDDVCGAESSEMIDIDVSSDDEFPSETIEIFDIDDSSDERNITVDVNDLEDIHPVLNKECTSDEIDKKTICNLIQALKDQNKAPPELIEKMKRLQIVLIHDVPPSHKIESRPSYYPSENERKLLTPFCMKTHKFSREEDRILKTNWKNFCEDYGFKDASSFITATKYLSSETRIKFCQYLGQGLPKRKLHQIYHRFCDICQPFSRGRFDPKEDELISLIMKSGCKTPAKLCSKLLRRPAACVNMRYRRMMEFEKVPVSNTTLQCTPQLAELILKSLVRILNCSVGDLKNRCVPASVWRTVGEELKIRPYILNRLWRHTVHYRLFAEKNLSYPTIAKKIIEWLHSVQPESERDIRWGENTHLIPGCTGLFLCMKFHSIKRSFNFSTFRSIRDFINNVYEERESLLPKLKNVVITRYEVNRDLRVSERDKFPVDDLD